MSQATAQLQLEAGDPPHQPFLFSPEIQQTLESTELETLGVITLERIKLRRPGLIEAIIELRSRGEGLLSIARLLRTHHLVVSKVEEEFPLAIDIARAKRVARLRSAADKLVEQIDASPESVPWPVKGLTACQLNDKAELLDGRATSRVEHADRVDIYASWESFIALQLPPPAGEVPEMGLSAREIPAIAESLVSRAIADAERAERGLCSDAESLVSGGSTKVDSPNDTTSATESDTESSPADPDPLVARALAQPGGGGGPGFSQGGAKT